MDMAKKKLYALIHFLCFYTIRQRERERERERGINHHFDPILSMATIVSRKI